MAKSIIIIGAGMGDMAAGIYGQINGYKTQILEMHTKPGGQCASWQPKGYTFDACIHHFFGCKPGSGVYQLWHELGAMPRELATVEDCTAVTSPDGKMFIDYYNLEKLEHGLRSLSSADTEAIRQYIDAIKAFANNKIGDTMLGGSLWKMITMFPSMLGIRRWIKMNIALLRNGSPIPF